MKIIDIALKDLVRSVRSMFSIGMMVVAPLLITGLIYFAFGGMTGGKTDLPELKVGIVNQDVPPADLPDMGQSLIEMLQDPSVSSWLKASSVADEASARADVDSRQLGLAVIVPAKFTESLLAGKGSSSVILVQDPTLSIGPTVVKNMVGSLVDAVTEASIAYNIANQQNPASTAAITSQFQAWFTDFQRTLYHSPQAALAIQSPGNAGGTADAGKQLIGLVMAGMMVFFAFYTGAYAMMSILKEDEEGTLARLFTTPTRRTSILTGKFLAVFLMVTIQTMVVMAASALAFKITWGDPLLVVLAVTGQVIAGSGMGVLLISLLKSSRQAGPVLGGALTALSMLGGLFTVAIQMPSGFNLVSRIAPQNWVLQGWKLAINGGSLAEMLLPFAICVGTGGIMFFIGARIFNRRFA